MSNTVAKITSKIVDITGNDATRAFVGKIVTRKSTSKGIVYVIGSTGYVLSTAEYKRFAEEGAIAQSTILPQKKKASKPAAAKSTPAPKEATLAPAVKAAQADKKTIPAVKTSASAPKTKAVTHSAKTETRAAASLATAAKSTPAEKIEASVEEDILVSAPDQFEFGTEEHHALLETSEFLMNYPKPSFEFDTPKHMSLFDKKDDLKERATGFFDRIGRKGRDKLVSAMTQE